MLNKKFVSQTNRAFPLIILTFIVQTTKSFFSIKKSKNFLQATHLKIPKDSHVISLLPSLDTDQTSPLPGPLPTFNFPATNETCRTLLFPNSP